MNTSDGGTDPRSGGSLTDNEVVARFATVLNEHSLNYVEDFVIVHCRCGWKSAHTDGNPSGNAHREYHEHVGQRLLVAERAAKPWVVKQVGHDRWEVWHLDGKQAVRDPESGFAATIFGAESAAQEMCDVLNVGGIR